MALDITGKVGWWSGSVNVAPSQDADALAFITAANITDTTQKSAINTLVTQLKTYGIWTKMKALYPFVGGTASSHKFNLKDPRDLDAAYRLVFAGGWTHSSTGALPNGTTAYADTKLNVNSILDGTSSHLSYYSRTTAIPGAGKDYYMMGAYDLSNSRYYAIDVYGATPNVYAGLGNIANTTDSPISNTKGLFLVKKETNNTQKVIINNITIDTQTQTQTLKPNYNIGLAAAINNVTGVYGYSTFESAFASIGDGLSDTEAANFYTAVQTFQTTLGRQVGVPIVADSDAQAFLNAAVITNQTQANAINTLVTDLKSANIWTKMKAIYPFVGGTATTHKFNLKDPRDLDAAYRLVFNGGWTHSSTGALPNGTNGYADTKLVPSAVQTVNSNGMGMYLGTLNTSTSSDPIHMGVYQSNSQTSTLLVNKANTNVFTSLNGTYLSSSTINALGLISSHRTSSTLTTIYKNSTNVGSGNSGGSLPTIRIALGNISANASAFILYGSGWTNSEFRLSYISDGLDSTDMTNLYNAVQAYQTTLSRNV